MVGSGLGIPGLRMAETFVDTNKITAIRITCSGGAARCIWRHAGHNYARKQKCEGLYGSHFSVIHT
jgi:hypothetical protein